MIITPILIDTYKKILLNPADHELRMNPLNDFFIKSDIATPKHILYIEFTNKIVWNIPKLVFYIIMDEMFPASVGKAPNGELGYFLTIK